MNILQINKMYDPDIGGVETVVKQYAGFLKEAGHEVTVLCIHKARARKTIVEYIEGIKVVRCSSFGTYFSMPVSLSFFYHFWRLARKSEALHFHEPFPLGTLAGLLPIGKKKVIITWHSDIIKQKFLKKTVEFFQRLLCKKADVITTTSPILAENSSVIADFREKTTVIPLSIDVEKYLAFKPEKDYFDLPEKYALYIGRLSYYKGIVILLEALDILDENVNIVIAGKGEEEEKIKRYIDQKKPKNITFINRFVSEEEKLYLLQNCSFLLFPSVAPSEAFGIVQLEAMVYGKSVINTSLPTGVPWVSVDQETGITVKPNSGSGLADAIKSLYFDEKSLAFFGSNAKRRISSMFSDSSVKINFVAIYH